MTQNEMDYLLGRLGQAFIAAGSSLIGSGGGSNDSGNTDTGNTDTGDNDSGATDSGGEDVVIDTTPALGEVAVIANRAPLRSQPTKDINVDMGRLLEGEKVALDQISEDKKWYRVDVRAFAGVHTIPDDAHYAWGEASNFEIITLN